MNYLKRIWRQIGLILLIALVVLGIGIVGGVPIPPSNKRENDIEMKIELHEKEEDVFDVFQLDFQQ